VQGMEEYIDGINNIVEAQQKVALRYFEEESVDSAIPPLKILLHIMAYGHYEGKDIGHPDLRKQFDRDFVVESEWYKERLLLKQQIDSRFLQKQIEYLKDFMEQPNNAALVAEMNIDRRLEQAREELTYINSLKYLNDLVGTIGADPLFKA
jgi:hypothetical protein